MNKKVILGPASGASEHNVAKPFGLGCRVDGTFARWFRACDKTGHEVNRNTLVFLSGPSTLVELRRGLRGGPTQESAEGIVAICTEESSTTSSNELGVTADGLPVQ